MPHPTCAWPAAVSPLVVDRLVGPERPARVLGVFPTALYLGVGDHEHVLPVITHDGLRLPTGLLLARPAREVAWGVLAGDMVAVGGGRVRLPGRDVVAVRQHRPCRVGGAAGVWGAGVPGGSQASPAAYDVVVGHERVSPVLRGLAQSLVEAALAGRPVAPHVAGLLGVGGGLTPSGDDALCGVLLGLRGIGGPEARAAHARVAAVVGASTSRTSSLSASLLLAATRGYAVPDVVRLVVLLTRSGESRDAGLDEVLRRVLAIGHSSGADLVAGLAGTVAAWREARVPCPA